MRIFGIGLSRTGTLSVAAALRLLGFSTVHYPWSLAELHQHDAALDLPVARWWRYLDATCPDAKFILTTRREETWLPSCQRHFSADSEPWRGAEPAAWTEGERAVAEVEHAVYGAWRFDSRLWIEAKRSHELAIHLRFQHTRGRLLVLDVENTPAPTLWAELTSFLELDDDIPFPWEHRTR